MEFNAEGDNWQAHKNSHDLPVPRELPKWNSTHGANDQKALLWHQNNYRLPSAHNSVMRNTELWVAGDFLSTARLLSLWLAAWGRPAGSSLSQAVPGQSQLQTRLGLQPDTIFQMPHSHPATQPCDELWTPFPSFLPLASVCPSRQPCQVAWPGSTAEAVQRNCSICTLSSAAATLLPTALLEVCCCDVFMKTCQIFPTINPGV